MNEFGSQKHKIDGIPESARWVFDQVSFNNSLLLSKANFAQTIGREQWNQLVRDTIRYQRTSMSKKREMIEHV
jgi:hypothetical protein